ncbi:MAG TPA: folylpolyglutamate synthase/dihydrofolate synthase family protein [Flavipsychrobacter sp.]|nr:folylpolyglutamate synthase/dihydrofolate synthase family protein [Flavipsychrobacter sp.]
MDTQIAYQQTLDYLYEQLPMFSKLGKDAIKKDLTNTRKLCEALGNPQEKFKSIHIAGTNGKGSTSHMLSAILQKAGYKTGLYTSPHLVDFRERIRINGIPVSKEWVVHFVEKNKAAIEEIQPSFFEITVAMAFAAFANENIDIAIIETGLGGRLDSTNIITPILSIITNISYDHMDLLGDTLPKIAAEKAGIIKKGIPVIIGEQHKETERVFFEHAIRNQSTLYSADAVWDLVTIRQDAQYQYYKAVNRAKHQMYDLHTDLLGAYQKHNIKTVLTATEVLITNQGLNLSLPIAFDALPNVKKLTGLHGRWEVIRQKPLIITDVGHNPAGMEEVMKQWRHVVANNKHIIVGFVKDKDVSKALAFFPKDAIYHFCNAQLPRALPSKELKQIAETLGLKGESYNTVADAINAVVNAMNDDDALLITGSFFVAGEAMEALGLQED